MTGTALYYACAGNFLCWYFLVNAKVMALSYAVKSTRVNFVRVILFLTFTSFISVSNYIPFVLSSFQVCFSLMVNETPISSTSRQKGLSTSHLYIQLDPFALKLTICNV